MFGKNFFIWPKDLADCFASKFYFIFSKIEKKDLFALSKNCVRVRVYSLALLCAIKSPLDSLLRLRDHCAGLAEKSTVRTINDSKLIELVLIAIASGERL